jgi:integrase
MRIFKRNSTYWADFSVDGRRHRISLDTPRWAEAQSRASDKREEAKKGQLQTGRLSCARAPFSEAAARFMETRAIEVKPKTKATEQHQLKPLAAFFGSFRLGKITADDVRAYQLKRREQGRGPRTVNHEVGLLRRIMKRGKVWRRIAGEFRFLKCNKRICRSITREQKERLLAVSKTRPDWQTARCAAILAMNTTMRSCELKALCWRDVNWFEKMLSVRSSKTDAGVREIPINLTAWNVLRELNERARTLGTAEPGETVFAIAPGRPVKSWRTAWKSLTASADIPGWRFHDTRHQAITEMAEHQNSDMTIMSIAGHIDPEMLKHYSSIRRDAKRKALEALDPAPTATQPSEQAAPRAVISEGKPV